MVMRGERRPPKTMIMINFEMLFVVHYMYVLWF